MVQAGGSRRSAHALLWGLLLAAALVVGGLALSADDSPPDVPDEPAAACLACAALGAGWMSEFVTARGLSPREVHVSGHIGFGWRSRPLSEHLGLSVRTVETHLHHVYEKLGLHSRVELALLAREHPPPT